MRVTKYLMVLFVVALFTGLPDMAFAQPPGKRLSKYEKNYYKWLKEQAQQKSFDSIVDIAENKFQAGSYQDALKLYNKALEILPNNTPVIAKKNDLILLLRFLEEPAAEEPVAVSEPKDTLVNQPIEVIELPVNNEDSIVGAIVNMQQLKPQDSTSTTKAVAVNIETEKKDSNLVAKVPEIKGPEKIDVQLEHPFPVVVDTPKAVVDTPAVESKKLEPEVVLGPPKEEKELPVKDSVVVVATQQKIVVNQGGGTEIKPQSADSSATKKEPTQHTTTKKTYKEGFTEEIEKIGNKTITYRIFVENGHADIYKKVVHSWGGVFYFKNDQSIGEVVWAETEELIKKYK